MSTLADVTAEVAKVKASAAAEIAALAAENAALKAQLPDPAAIDQAVLDLAGIAADLDAAASTASTASTPATPVPVPGETPVPPA